MSVKLLRQNKQKKGEDSTDTKILWTLLSPPPFHHFLSQWTLILLQLEQNKPSNVHGRLIFLPPRYLVIISFFWYKISLMAIFISLDIYCTVRLFSIFIWSPPELSLIPSLSPSPLANQHRVLLLDNLDDVFVLHDMRQADPLGAVLGTGSLEDKKVSRYQRLPSCMYLRRTTKLDSQTRLNYKTLFSLIIKKHQECVVSFKHTTGR